MKKNIIWGIGGIILGVVAGIFVDRKFLTKTDGGDTSHLEEVDALLAEINQLNTDLMEISKRNTQMATDISKELTPNPSKINAHPAMVNGDRDNLRRLASKYHDRDLTEHLVERESPSEEDYDVYSSECPVVEVAEEKAHELVDHAEGLELEQVYYYPMDDILLDMNGDIMIETIDVFGAVLQGTIRDRTEDFIFTVSWPHGLVYEIVMEHGTSYYGNPDGGVDPDGETEDMSEFESDLDDFDPRYPNG